MQLCSKMCGVTGQIVCPMQLTMSACVSTCLTDATTCGPQSAAYYACLVENGPAALMCDDAQMIVILNKGYCAKESAALVACLTAMP
jgi:hypothetical protein